jgi:hypothetical protein
MRCPNDRHWLEDSRGGFFQLAGRTLTGFASWRVIDDFNNECLAAVSEVSLSGLRDECLTEDVFTTLAEAR